MKIYLFRHGETKANLEKRYLGVTDEPLSEEGKKNIVAKVRENYYPKYEGQIIYTSALQRTKQTLNLIYGDVEYQVDARLNESDFGDFENKSYEELKEDLAYQTWITGDHLANRCPHGESFRQMQNRVVEAFAEIVAGSKETGKDVMLFLHGGPIVAIMKYMHPEEDKTFYEWNIACGEFSQVIYK